MARVIHLFRGSWKDPWPFGIDRVLDVAGASGGEAESHHLDETGGGDSTGQ